MTAQPRIANAPVSYGVFGEISVAGATTPAQVLRQMAEAGYAGSELGPPGFFGTVEETVGAFTDAGLAPVGAYVPLHTQCPGPILERDLARMRQTFDELAAVGGGLAILADEGDPTLLAHPRHDRELGLDEAGWRQLVETVESARLEAESRGLETSFHPHIATYIERPWEVERLLADTAVPLCFDMAHIALGGGDAVADFERWRERINHVHVKDARTAVFEQAVTSGRDDFGVWWEQLCVPLGTGDLPVEEFLDAVQRSGYAGWLVVEQDGPVVTPDTLAAVVADQAHNYQWLSERLRPNTDQTRNERTS